MGIVVQNPFTVQTPQLIDDRTSYPTVEAAMQALTPIRRAVGLTVFIASEGREYWFRDGIGNDDFILKSVSASTSLPLTWSVD